EPAPVALFNETLGEPLRFAADTVTAEPGVYVIPTPHFSNWFPVWWSDLLDRAGRLLDRLFGPPPSADVQCAATGRAEELGFDTKRVGSDAYRVCLDADGDTAIIRVGNPNSFPVSVETTPDLRLRNPDETLVSLLPRL